MPSDALFQPGILLGFLLVLSRVAGAFVFVPLPGMKTGGEAAKVALALSVTISLAGQWPQATGLETSLARLLGAVLVELVFGLAAGLLISFLTEALQMGAQIISLQAGFSFATTIDPSSQTDSGILLIVAQLFAGLLFFSLGLHREVIRAFAGSLSSLPAGSPLLNGPVVSGVLHAGGAIFTTGLRLAFPIVALLLLADIALALVGRLNSQLQLLTLAFPLKILLALGLLLSLTGVYSFVYRGSADQIVRLVRALPGTLQLVR